MATYSIFREIKIISKAKANKLINALQKSKKMRNKTKLKIEKKHEIINDPEHIKRIVFDALDTQFK